MNKIKKCRSDHTSVVKLAEFLSTDTSSNTGIVYAVTLIVEVLVSVRKRRKHCFNDSYMNCFTSRTCFSHYIEIRIPF